MKTVIFDSSITIDSPIGPIALKSFENAVVKVDLLGLAPAAVDSLSAGAAASAAPVSPVPAKVLVAAASQLKDFFAGKRKNLDFAVAYEGTDFQRAVWSEIAKIGFGEAITYAEIARRIGNPSAVRAVGGAVGSNPVPLVIGCHRILGSGDKITGYSGGDGLPTKRWLLAHEGIAFRDVPEVRRDAEAQIKIE
jgi:methylated-DNA-[protein]-cysteine S-methyltransferase